VRGEASEGCGKEEVWQGRGAARKGCGKEGIWQVRGVAREEGGGGGVRSTSKDYYQHKLDKPKPSSLGQQPNLFAFEKSPIVYNTDLSNSQMLGNKGFFSEVLI